MFGQTFEPHDLLIVGLLVVLEGVLSIDNALVLGLLAKRLPKRLQRKALTYGLVGAFIFRFVAIASAAYLLQWRFVKLLGGLYLVYVAVRHFFFSSDDADHEAEHRISTDAEGHPLMAGPTGTPPREREEKALAQRAAAGLPSIAAHLKKPKSPRGQFWQAVVVIELTDIAFAVDSIVAALGLVGSASGSRRHPKLWVVLVGGMLGVVLMRFASIIFIRLLERFPRFETSAYLLVVVIGAKLIADYLFNTSDHPGRVNFHNPDSVAFWVFWVLMLASFCAGFLPQRKHAQPPDAAHG